MTDPFRRLCLVAAVIAASVYSATWILHDLRLPVRLLPGVSARVNGRVIDADSVRRTVAGLTSRDPHPVPQVRRQVLGRMIDEELLVQHALDSGAAESSPEVRAALVRSAIARVNAEAEAAPVTDSELQQYFQAHSRLYATAARFQVTPSYLQGDGAPAASAPFNFPTQPVSSRTLTDYFGPAAADAVARLGPGQTSGPIDFGDGQVRLQLVSRVAGSVPSLASIRDLVLADALRDRQERALEALLASLRDSARIETNE